MERGIYIKDTATLETAMQIFERSSTSFIPVMSNVMHRHFEVIGVLRLVDALKAYSRALVMTAAKKHS